jgi:hypothetical protein
MRYRAPQLLLFVVVAALCSNRTSIAQTSLEPTPDPIVFADNESWYLSGTPITFAGNIYYAAGPQVHFSRYEMYRSGFFQGIPLYSRATLEPYSIVFVPLRGGLMQPYERRRAGDVAGTVGSTTPSFPVVLPAEQDDEAARAGLAFHQAPTPPMLGRVPPELLPGADPYGRTPSGAVGLAGTTPPEEVEPARIQTLRRPQGLNGVYIEYDGRTWFSDGPAVEYSRNLFTRVEDYHGFGVYRDASDPRRIYVALFRDAPGLIAPYRLR